jgi:predicted RNA binding protein YcfA (HicA-like mRNA interferase family)
MRAKVYSSREIVRILNANNYFAVSRKGSHIKYYNAETKLSFVLTTDKEVNPMIWKKIVKTYNIIII